MLNNELKQNPFCVPDGYFESLQEQADYRKCALDEELRQNPFGVPEGYFASLQEKIAERVADTTPQIAFPALDKRHSWHSQLAFAASFILLVGMGYGMLKLIAPATVNNSQLADDDIYTLIQSVVPSISEATLMDAVLDDNSFVAETELIGSEDIIDYLSDANLSIYYIMASLE